MLHSLRSLLRSLLLLLLLLLLLPDSSVLKHCHPKISQSPLLLALLVLLALLHSY